MTGSPTFVADGGRRLARALDALPLEERRRWLARWARPGSPRTLLPALW